MNRQQFESELDFQKSWSMKAGELAGLKCAKSIVMDAATESFVAGRSDANSLRELAQRIGKLEKSASDELGEYIALGNLPKKREALTGAGEKHDDKN